MGNTRLNQRWASYTRRHKKHTDRQHRDRARAGGLVLVPRRAGVATQELGWPVERPDEQREETPSAIRL